jgi:hypothetical protein
MTTLPNQDAATIAASLSAQRWRPESYFWAGGSIWWWASTTQSGPGVPITLAVRQALQHPTGNPSHERNEA